MMVAGTSNSLSDGSASDPGGTGAAESLFGSGRGDAASNSESSSACDEGVGQGGGLGPPDGAKPKKRAEGGAEKSIKESRGLSFPPVASPHSPPEPADTAEGSKSALTAAGSPSRTPDEGGGVAMKGVEVDSIALPSPGGGSKQNKSQPQDQGNQEDTPSKDGSGGSAVYSTRKRKREEFQKTEGPLEKMPPIHEADAMILTKIDEKAHQACILKDSDTLMEKILFPMSFPWHKPKALVLRRLPTDIDECEHILHADSSSDDGLGVFGYGKYETGDHRKGRARSDVFSESLLDCCYDKVVSAARRSEDSGQIELAAMMPPPHSSVDLMALFSFQRDNTIPCGVANPRDPDKARKIRALVDAERAEKSSSMPLFWKQKDRDSCFNPSAFVNGEWGDSEDENGCDREGMEQRKARADFRRKKNRAALRKACVRKWKVSVKVATVSTRSVLFRHVQSNTGASKGESHDDDSGGPVQRKTWFRPVLRTATITGFTQLGRSTSTDTTAQAERGKIANGSLGSNDYTEKLGGSKKRASASRTRLVWIGTGTDESLSNRNRTFYTSLITGEKVDPPGHKRPREMRVGVRLHGRLLMEEVEEKASVPPRCSGFDAQEISPVVGRKNIGRKQRQQEETRAASCSSILVPAVDVRSVAEIDSAISLAIRGIGTKEIKLSDPRDPAPNTSNAMCTLDRKKILDSMPKKVQNKRRGQGRQAKPKQEAGKGTKKVRDGEGESVPSAVDMKHRVTNTLEHIPPSFSFLPLDDGPIRVVCTSPGSLKESCVHDMLNRAARKYGERESCTVCWTGDGVRECIDCGLLVHPDCCQDKGTFLCESDGQSSSVKGEVNVTQGDGQALGLHMNGTHQEQARQNCCSVVDSFSRSSWRCPVCQEDMETCGMIKKPRRVAKVPSRFRDDVAFTPGQHEEILTKQSPRAKCTLCPHRGGAMSRVQRRTGDRSCWAHEVCRIWCGGASSFIEEEKKGGDVGISVDALLPLRPFSNQLPVVCALCGMGTTYGVGREMEKASSTPGFETRQTDNAVSQVNESFPLVKCAARGCFVFFHPMCALLVSKVNAWDSGDSLCSSTTATVDKESKNHSANETTNPYVRSDTMTLQRRKEADNMRCSQYVLTLLQTKRTEGTFGSLSGREISSILPIAFCGLHNPQREQSFYGCPAGGGTIGSSMRVPPV